MKAYQPSSNLYATLRWSAPGNPQNVLVDSEGFFAPRRRFILLVHGYNVSERSGQKTLHGFESRLRGYSISLASDVGWLMWPGDAGVPLIGGAAYPLIVLLANEIADRIARFLQKLRNAQGEPAEIVLVAHSLGCRVTLEALRILEEAAFNGQIWVLLMAAAVPVAHVAPGGRLRDAAGFAGRRAVMHSSQDLVLQALFRMGQSVVPTEPRWSQAVGTAGLPEDLWTDSFPMTGFGHGSYWTRTETAALFVQWMGRAAPRKTPRRSLPTHPLPGPRVMFTRSTR